MFYAGNQRTRRKYSGIKGATGVAGAVIEQAHKKPYTLWKFPKC
jgi:hypothetical protein